MSIHILGSRNFHTAQKFGNSLKKCMVEYGNYGFREILHWLMYKPRFNYRMFVKIKFFQ